MFSEINTMHARDALVHMTGRAVSNNLCSSHHNNKQSVLKKDLLSLSTTARTYIPTTADLNPGPSSCEATVITTTPLYCPYLYHECKNMLTRHPMTCLKLARLEHLPAGWVFIAVQWMATRKDWLKGWGVLPYPVPLIHPRFILTWPLLWSTLLPSNTVGGAADQSAAAHKEAAVEESRQSWMWHMSVSVLKLYSFTTWMSYNMCVVFYLLFCFGLF